MILAITANVASVRNANAAITANVTSAKIRRIQKNKFVFV